MKPFGALRMRPTARPKWRVKFLWLAQATGGASAREIQFRETAGGPNLCTGATITASAGTSPYQPSAANDNSYGTEWQHGAVLSEPQWWQAEFTAAATVNHVTLRMGANPRDWVKHFDVQYYDGVNWVTHFSIRDAVFASDGLGTFTLDQAAGLGAELLSSAPTTAGGWSWASSVATASNATTGLTWAGVTTAGDLYQLSLNYTKTAGANLRVADSSGTALAVVPMPSAAGELFVFFVAKGTGIKIEADTANFTGTLTSISMKKVTQSTYGYGAELLADPSFDTGTGWAFSGGWSLGSGKALGSIAADRIAAAGVLTAGVTYRVGLHCFRSSAAKLRIRTETNTNLYVSPTIDRPTSTFYFEIVSNGTDLRLEADSAEFTGEIYGMSVRQKL